MGQGPCCRTAEETSLALGYISVRTLGLVAEWGLALSTSFCSSYGSCSVVALVGLPWRPRAWQPIVVLDTVWDMLPQQYNIIAEICLVWGSSFLLFTIEGSTTDGKTSSLAFNHLNPGLFFFQQNASSWPSPAPSSGPG